MGLPPKSTVLGNPCTVFASVGRFQKFKMQMKAEIWARLVRTLIFTNSKSAKFYIETTCGRMGFQHFSRIHFFRKLPPEADSDRVLDFNQLIRASSRYFLGNELLRSPAGHLMQKLCNMKSRPPPSLWLPSNELHIQLAPEP